MVKVTLFNTGHCNTWGKIAVNAWSWQKRSFPAIVAMIEHPKEGIILFDTGYSDRFFSSSQNLPFRMYRWITEVHHKRQESIKYQLNERGISLADVHTIFISHFHADHLCGLCDFPNASFVCSKDSACEIENLNGIKAVLKGFLPDLLPKNFLKRAYFLDANNAQEVGIPNSPFEMGIDLFGDRSIVAISLPGHTKGQMGLLINQELFLIADAAWNSEAVKQNHPPHVLAHLLHHSKKEYLETFYKLHLFSKSHPEIIQVPSHCWSVLSNVVNT